MNRQKSLQLFIGLALCIFLLGACNATGEPSPTAALTLELPTAAPPSLPGANAPTSAPLADTTRFPIGWFDCPDCGSSLQGYTQEYAGDGTLTVYNRGAPELSGQWYVEGDIYHTGDSYCNDFDEMPATYHWEFDGQYLTMELIEDNCTVRINSMDGMAWRLYESIPIATYSANDGQYIFEIGEENSYKFFEEGGLAAFGLFSTNGNEVTWETDSYCDGKGFGKATYTWQFENDVLTFRLVGTDDCEERIVVLDGLPYHKEDTALTGTFTARTGKYVLEIGDGNFTFSKTDGTFSSFGTYSLNENEITWETDHYCAQEGAESATYSWQFDANILFLESIGSDPCAARKSFLLFAFAKEP